ncbi:MAG: Ig-like domain-containing protein [Oscillospiraceae bacterium]|nr:Ig-like domain-containing protein [Oscillospiraceae bacterium]
MTITGIGSADIIASYTADGVTLTSVQTVTVSLPDSFSITGPDTVSTGKTIQLGIDKPFGTFTWSSSDPDIASVNPDTGEVTGISAGTVTIRATRSDGTIAEHEITVTVDNQPITGTVGDRRKENTTYSYVYDPAQRTITVTGYFEQWDQGAYPALNTVDVIKDLIPVKHEVLDYSGTVQWKLNDFGMDFIGSAAAETPGNTKSFAEMTGETNQSQNTVLLDSSGERTIVITLKPDNVTEQIANNQNFGSDGNMYLNRTVYDGEVTIQLHGEPNAHYKIVIKGKGHPNYNSENNYPSDGISGTLDENGNATITYQLPVTLIETKLQLWEYRNDGGDLDKSDLTVVSCTAHVPDSGGNTTNAAPAQGRSLMRRFSTGALRMGTAEAYVEIPLAAPLRAGESGAVATEASAFSSSGTMDITLKATDTWQKLITGLPVYTVAADGTVYTNYYWAEEIALNGQPVAGYQTAYTFTDGDAATSYMVNAAQPGEQPSIVIRNTPTEEAVELPVTGGRKASGYCLAGGVLLLLSAAGLIYEKRRRWLNG